MSPIQNCFRSLSYLKAMAAMACLWGMSFSLRAEVNVPEEAFVDELGIFGSRALSETELAHIYERGLQDFIDQNPSPK